MQTLKITLILVLAACWGCCSTQSRAVRDLETTVIPVLDFHGVELESVVEYLNAAWQEYRLRDTSANLRFVLHPSLQGKSVPMDPLLNGDTPIGGQTLAALPLYTVLRDLADLAVIDFTVYSDTVTLKPKQKEGQQPAEELSPAAARQTKP